MWKKKIQRNALQWIVCDLVLYKGEHRLSNRNLWQCVILEYEEKYRTNQLNFKNLSSGLPWYYKGMFSILAFHHKHMISWSIVILFGLDWNYSDNCNVRKGCKLNPISWKFTKIQYQIISSNDGVHGCGANDLIAMWQLNNSDKKCWCFGLQCNEKGMITLGFISRVETWDRACHPHMVIISLNLSTHR